MAVYFPLALISSGNPDRQISKGIKIKEERGHILYCTYKGLFVF